MNDLYVGHVFTNFIKELAKQDRIIKDIAGNFIESDILTIKKWKEILK